MFGGGKVSVYFVSADVYRRKYKYSTIGTRVTNVTYVSIEILVMFLRIGTLSSMTNEIRVVILCTPPSYALAFHNFRLKA